jgi:hypothetical protein
MVAADIWLELSHMAVSPGRFPYQSRFELHNDGRSALDNISTLVATGNAE